LTLGAAVDNPTTPVRTGEELDWAALNRHLKKFIPNLRGEPAVSQFAGGNSNLTYRLEYDNDELVVRRPPFGTRAKSAHSMIREYRIMSQLKPVFPSVPDTLHYSDDESVIGSEFYVMRKVEGQLIKQTIPSRWHFTAEDNRRFCTLFWEKLIELHKVDYIAAGLGDFGKPVGYAERQITGWNRRFERVITPDVDNFAAVRQWLGQRIPAESGRHSILHGDYRIDNVIFAKDDPHKILAVLDWEICALGDPLMDLGSALAYWMQADDPIELRGLLMQPSDAAGMLTRQEILDLYQDKTGLDTSGFIFYQVYGYWRVAVILQQIYYRYFHGQTRDERFKTFGIATQNLGEHCQRLIKTTENDC
jgi:aminoglycoside phosphotransferase (APT) family kinase protein